MARRGINRTTIVGNLGADPEIRYLPTGTPVATISVATTEGWTDKESGEQRERTEWHRIVFYDRLAKVLEDFARKGTQVYVEGSNRTEKFQDSNTGEDRYTHYIRGRVLQLLSGKPGAASAEEVDDTHVDLAVGEGGLAEA